MTKSIKTGIIILVFVLIITLVVSTSLTFAIWDSEAGSGDGKVKTFGPVTDSTQWNVYAKYFEYEYPTDDTCVITGFSGVNIEDIIIPATIGGGQYKVVGIKKLFNDTTRKLPVTVKIPYTVTSIAPAVFQNCENLQKVTFGSYSQPDSMVIECACGEYLFAGCTSLSLVEVLGNRQVCFKDYDFVGCTSLTEPPTLKDVFINFKSGDDDISYIIEGSKGKITYTANAKVGASFS